MNYTGQGFTADGSRVGPRPPRARSRPADDDGRMIAAAMAALAVWYADVDMRCTRCGLYRHEHVRGMNLPGKRACSKFTERRPAWQDREERQRSERRRQRGLRGLRPVYGLLVMTGAVLTVIVLGPVT